MEIQLLTQAELASEPDLYACLAGIWQQSVMASHNFLSKEYFIRLQEEIEHTCLPGLEYILTCGRQTKIHGFLGGNGNFVEMLFIEPAFFGKGLGSSLIQYATKLHGPLRLHVNSQNTKALKFYMGQGFAIDGYRTHDSLGQPYPLFCLSQPAT